MSQTASSIKSGGGLVWENRNNRGEDWPSFGVQNPRSKDFDEKKGWCQEFKSVYTIPTSRGVTPSLQTCVLQEPRRPDVV